MGIVPSTRIAFQNEQQAAMSATCIFASLLKVISSIQCCTAFVSVEINRRIIPKGVDLSSLSSAANIIDPRAPSSIPVTVISTAAFFLRLKLRLNIKALVNPAIGGISPLRIGGKDELTWLIPIVTKILSDQSSMASGKNEIKLVSKSSHLPF
jgi:hypothetical protein